MRLPDNRHGALQLINSLSATGQIDAIGYAVKPDGDDMVLAEIKVKLKTRIPVEHPHTIGKSLIIAPGLSMMPENSEVTNAGS
jgi:hypothetical protein